MALAVSMPVAVNCMVCPTAIVESAGVTGIPWAATSTLARAKMRAKTAAAGTRGAIFVISELPFRVSADQASGPVQREGCPPTRAVVPARRRLPLAVPHSTRAPEVFGRVHATTPLVTVPMITSRSPRRSQRWWEQPSRRSRSGRRPVPKGRPDTRRSAGVPHSDGDREGSGYQRWRRRRCLH